MADMRYDIEIGYSTNKQSLSTLQADLKAISNTLQNMSPTQKMDAGIQKSINTVGQLNSALRDCYDVDLGKLNTAKFSEQLKKADISVKDLKADLTRVGPEGAKAFNSIGSAILSTNLQIKQGSKLLDDFARTFTNTIKYNISGGIYRSVVSSVQQAINYTKHLDTSLNDIRIVTDKSAESMQKFAKQANEAAKSLGKSTIDYTEASLIYYQQGLSDEDVKARTDVTLKAANVTGQATSQVSEQLTAVWNGYKVDAEEAELYVDKLAAVAATTASDLEELSTGMSKVASAANAMGVDVDQLNAQLATIVSVTRQAPESVGTALKTIYARMSTIEAGGEDEGTKLKNYTEQMAQFGFNVLDSQGKLRDMGAVIEEIGGKWNTLSREQQVALAQAMAGTRQYNNLLALFENWDMYSKALKTSTDAVGTLQKQQDIYMDSTKAHLQQTQTATQELYDTLIKTTELNWGVDQLTNAVEVINDMIGTFGGGLKSFAGIGMMIAGIFSKQIGAGIQQLADNFNAAKTNAEALRLVTEQIQTKAAQVGKESSNSALAQQRGYEAQLQEVAKIKATVGNTEVYNDLINKAQQEYEYVTQTELKRLSINNTIERYKTQIEQANSELLEEEMTVENLESIQIELKRNYEAQKQQLQETKTEIKYIEKEENKRIEQLETEIALKKESLAQLQEYSANSKMPKEVRNRTNTQISNITADINNKQAELDALKVRKETVGTLESQVNATKKAIDGTRNLTKTEADAAAAESEALKIKLQINQAVERQIESQFTLGATLSNSLAILGSVSMAWMSVSSAINTVKEGINGDIGFGDMLSRLAMTAAMLGPNIVSVVTKMKDLIPTSQTLATYYDIQLKKLKEQNVENFLSKELKASELASQMRAYGYQEAVNRAMAQYDELALKGELTEEKKLEILRAELETQTELNAKKRTEDLINNMSTGSKMMGGFTTGAKSLFTKNNGIAAAAADFGGAGAAGAALIPILIGIAGALGVIYAIEKPFQAQNEKLIASWERKAELYRENRQAAEEEANSIHELHNAYKELIEDQDDSSLSKEELKDKVYKLCLQYGEEELAVRSLTMSYEELNKTMSEIESGQRTRINSNAKEEMAALQQALKGQVNNISTFNGDWADSLFGDGYSASSGAIGNLLLPGAGGYIGGKMGGGTSIKDGIVDTDWVMSQDEKSYAQNIAQSLGLDANAFIQNGKASMQVEQYIDAMAQNKEAFLEALNAEGGGDFAKELKIIVDEQFLNNLDAYNEAYKAVQENTQTQIVNGFADGAYQDFESFALAFQNSVAQLEAEGVEDARAWLMKQLSDESFDDTTLSYLKSMSLANILANEDDFEQIAEMISKFSDEERDYMSAHPWLFAGLSESEIREKLQSFSNIIERDISLKDAAKIQTIIDLVDENGNAFTKETIEQIFNKDNGIDLRIDKEEFLKLNDAEKLAELRFAQFANVATANSADTQATETQLNSDLATYNTEDGSGFKEYITRFENANEVLKEYADLNMAAFNDENIQQGLEATNQYLQQQAQNLDMSVEEYKELVKAYEEYQALQEKALTTDFTEEDRLRADELADKYAKDFSADLEKSSDVVKNNDLYKELDKVRSKYNAFITDLENGVADLQNKMYSAELFEGVQEDLKNVSSGMDNLQSAYKSLTNIVKDYNDNQHLTLDNLQSLLSMEPAYLACLEMEDGQMKLNEDSLRYLLQAKLESAKATIYEQQALRIKGIIEQDGIQISAAAEAAEARLAATTDNSVGAYMRAAAALEYYNEVKAQGEQLSGAAADQIAETIRQTDLMIQSIDSIDLTDLKSTLSPSGGGSSKKKDKELKQLDKEFDRYWQINKAIDKLATSLERLDKLQDNLHGKELIRSLQKENALIEEQEQKYRELYDEQRQEAGELQGQLASFGVAFGADGAILNYADATQRALAEFNNAVAAYNAGTLSDEAYDAAEKTYNAFKDALNRYDTLFYDEMKATQDKIIQAWKDKLANNLQAWETEIQIELDLSEAERDWNEFIHHISKDFKAVYENIPAELEKIIKDSATYTEDNGTIDVHIKAVNDVEKEIDKLMGGGDSDMFESVSQAQEKLKELMGDLEHDATTVFDLWEKAWDNYLATIDQGKDKLDDLLDKMKNIGEELEFQGQLIELIYGDKAYALMTKLFDAQKNNSLLQVDSVRQQRDMWKKLYDEAEEGNEDKQKYYENWIEAQEQLNDLVIEHIELLKKDYLNAVSSIIDTVKKKTTGGDLEFAKQQWKDRQSMEKGFYDDTERVYQIETMQNKWEEMITNAPLNQQKKLTDLMNQQIEKLKDKTRLSEYDIGLAERELQITQARIDLENAQNSKNSMKVTRGTDGNWAYQYVADEDDVANKQQALLDAINDKYEYIKNKNQEVLESLLNNVDEYWTRYYEIMEDTTLKDEEREERLAELWETYYGEEGLLTVAYAEAEQTKQDLNQATFELLEEAYEQNQISYEEMTLAQQALIDGLKDGTISDYEDIQAACQVINDESLVSWQTMAQEMANAWNADDGQSIKSQVLAAMEECERALEEYGRELDYLAAVADMDFSESGITGSIDMADQATQELIMTTEVLIDEITSGISNAIGVVDQMAYAWQSVQSEILNAIGLLQEYLQLMGEEKSFNFDGITQGLAKGLEAIKSASGSGGSSSTTGTKGNKINGTFTYFTTDSSGNKLYKDQSTGKIYSETQLSSAADTSGTHAVLREATSLSKSYGIYGGTSGYQTPSGRVYPTQEAALNEMRSQSTYYGLTDEELKKYIKKFASGGYTGTWGSDGRLAMLHEKELVLNAADTKNILSVVDTVRDLSGLGSSISSVVAEGIASTLAKLAGIKAGNTTSYTTTNTANNSTSNNVFNVTIDGSQFRDVEELKEAILSLPNYAAQMRHSTLK